MMIFGQISREELLNRLKESMEPLTDREKEVLKYRFGLESGESKTLKEVGKKFNLTRERIRQIEAKALRRMRTPERTRKLTGFIEMK